MKTLLSRAALAAAAMALGLSGAAGHDGNGQSECELASDVDLHG